MGRPRTHQSEPSAFADWLKKTRNDRGYTINSLADRADISPAHISKLESGRANASRDMVTRLAKCLLAEDISDASAVYTVNQGLMAAGFVPIDDERDPAHDDLMEAGYSELSEEARKVIVTLVKQMRQK